MVCPNCKSTDIVAIQGVNYCINCGQKVESAALDTVMKPVKAATKTVKKAMSVSGATDITVTAKAKTKPRPAVVTQDVPQIKIRTKPKPPAPVEKSSLIINHPTVSAPKITVKPASKAESVASIPARASSKAAPLDLRSDERKQVVEARKSMLSRGNKPSTRLSDVRVRKATAPAAPNDEPSVMNVSEASAPLTPQIDVKAKPVVTERRHEPAVKPVDNKQATTGRTGEGSALVFAWKQLGNWRYLVLALSSAIVAGIPALIWKLNVDTVRLYQLIGSGPSQLIGTDLLTNSIKYGGVWVGMALMVYAVHVIVANAITYAAAKSHEGRAAKWKSWLTVALNSLWGVIRIDLVLLPLWGILILGEAFILQSVVYGSLPQLQQWLILVPVHIVMLYLGLGLVFIRLLGGYGVVLGDLETKPAIMLGWRLYRKRTLALAVCGLIGGIVSTMIYLPALALNYANRDLPADVSGLGQILGASAFTAVLSALTTVFVTTYFFKHYRRSVLSVLGHSKPELLSARQPKPIRLSAKLGILAIILLVMWTAGISYSNPGIVQPTVEHWLQQINS